MLGGIKAILFLKHCSTQLSPLRNPIPASASEWDVTSARPGFNWGMETINVPAADWGTCEARDYPSRPRIREDLEAMFSALGETVVWRWR